MSINLTAQIALGGSGYDDKFMLTKAKREFKRLRESADLTVAMDHAINFSICLASVVDWFFHLRLSKDSTWAGKNETNFLNWIRLQKKEVAVFVDISNEAKHANRKYQNFSLKKVGFVPLLDKSKYTQEEISLLSKNGISLTTDKGVEVIYCLMIEYADNSLEFFYSSAESALTWWENLDYSSPEPVVNSTMRNMRL